MSSVTKKHRRVAGPLIAAAAVLASGAIAFGQTVPPSPSPVPAITATPLESTSGAPLPSESPTTLPAPTPTPAPLAAQPDRITVAPGVTQPVKIRGATAPITAQISSPIATVNVDQTTGFLYVQALTLGSATLHVTDARGAAVDIPVVVAQPAGIIPPTLTVTVTGNPADPRFLQRQIQEALRRVIRPTLQPGASIAFSPLPIPLQPLQTGFTTTIDVPVSIAGFAQYAPVFATTSVTVTNMQLETPAPSTLFYSDDPEYVQIPGVLFSGTVQPEGAARLYYYHDNLGLPKDIAVVITPASALPTRVHIIDVRDGPNLDVMAVGHNVSRTFMLDEGHNQGVVVDLSPQTPFILHNTLALAGELVAGIADVRILSGGPVTVTVLAYPAGSALKDYLNGPAAPPDGHNRHGIFNLAGFGDATIAYTVGGADASYQYGGRAITPQNVDPSSLGHDFGDYGVIHHFTFDIDNPLTTPQSIYLYEKPSGWPSINSFIIDGQLKQMGCVRVQQRYLITTYQVAPQSQITTTIETMTAGGSSYPLEIGLTQTPPNLTTPANSDPDGCFPKATPTPSATPVPNVSPTPASEVPLPSPSESPLQTLPPAVDPTTTP